MTEKMPRRREGVLLQGFGDETVLYDESTKRVHVLNATARLIWEHCNGTTTVDELVSHMLARYSKVEETKLRKDVEKVLSTFTKERLVDVGVADGTPSEEVG